MDNAMSAMQTLSTTKLAELAKDVLKTVLSAATQSHATNAKNH